MVCGRRMPKVSETYLLPRSFHLIHMCNDKILFLEGLLPMHYAAQRDKSRTDNVEAVQYLLSLNPDGDVVNSNNLDFDDEEDDEDEVDDDGEEVAKLQNSAQRGRRKSRGSMTGDPDRRQFVQNQDLISSSMTTMGKALLGRFFNRGERPSSI